MRKIIGFLFPWRKTFRRLELEKRWWHRLAVVLFFIAIIPLLLCSWVIADEVIGPAYSFDHDIHHWAAMIGAPSGVLFDLDGEQPLENANTSQTAPASAPIILQKTIEMPDGTVARYPGTTSDDSIKAEWQRQEHLATTRAVLLSLGIGALVTLFFSYALQTLYRALLYVIFGAKARGIPPNPTAAE